MIYPITLFVLAQGARAVGYQWLALWCLATDIHYAMEGTRHDDHH